MKKLFIISAVLMLVLSFKTEALPRHNGVDFNFFYSSLSPYGEWIEIDYDVYAWHPSGVGRHWMPYSDGRWVWSNHGWYWDSYEPFGWATFHYGRWYYDDYYGWMWLPDNEWGPAWVDWRYDDDYIGWSPLPPYAHFGIDFGIHFSIDWVAPVHYWSFVRYNHFCGHDVHSYIVADKYRNNIYKHTKYRNDYGYSNGRIVNRGVDRDFVERRAGTRITERELITTTRARDNFSDRNSNNRVEVYRPSDDAVKKTRNINKIEVRKSERTTNLDLKKIEREKLVRPDSKNEEKVIIRKESNKTENINRNENKNRTNVEKNVNRNEERTIEKKRETENKSSVETKSDRIKNENRNEIKRESKNSNINKSANENRTIEKRATENRNTESRKIERSTENSRSGNKSTNDRVKVRTR